MTAMSRAKGAAPMRAQAVPTHVESELANFRMLSGRIVNLLDPSPLDIDVNDFIVGASRIARWAGQTRGEISYNVLHHGIVVYEIMRDVVLRCEPGKPSLRAAKKKRAAGHDLHEAGGIGDVVTPVGKCIDVDTGRLDELKFRLDRAIFPNAGIPYGATPADESDIVAAVKRADRIAAASEAIQLLGCDEAFARKRYAGGWQGPLYPRRIEPMDEIATRRAFYALVPQMGLTIAPPVRSAA